MHLTAAGTPPLCVDSSIKAVVGNIGVFGTNMHVWTADTQTAAERSAWVAQSTKWLPCNPRLVLPAHACRHGAGRENVTYTKGYLQAFEKNAAATKTSAELIDAMKKAYPAAPMGLSLEIGAKVNKGEMKW